MSAAENKALVESLFASAAKGDRARFTDTLADDLVMRVTGFNSWSHTYTSKQEFLTVLHGHLNTLLKPGRRTVPLNFWADGEHVVVEARGEMERNDGVPYRNEYCLVFRLRDGKIVEFREYMDSALCEQVLGKFPGGVAAE